MYAIHDGHALRHETGTLYLKVEPPWYEKRCKLPLTISRTLSENSIRRTVATERRGTCGSPHTCATRHVRMDEWMYSCRLEWFKPFRRFHSLNFRYPRGLQASGKIFMTVIVIEGLKKKHKYIISLTKITCVPRVFKCHGRLVVREKTRVRSSID